VRGGWGGGLRIPPDDISFTEWCKRHEWVVPTPPAHARPAAAVPVYASSASTSAPSVHPLHRFMPPPPRGGGAPATHESVELSDDDDGAPWRSDEDEVREGNGETDTSPPNHTATLYIGKVRRVVSGARVHGDTRTAVCEASLMPAQQPSSVVSTCQAEQEQKQSSPARPWRPPTPIPSRGSTPAASEYNSDGSDGGGDAAGERRRAGEAATNAAANARRVQVCVCV
jgi:hypothetical protein